MVQLNMQQCEQGLRDRGKAKPLQLEVNFPASPYVMAGQLISFKLPTSQNAEWQAQLGGDMVSRNMVIREDSCICCLDVQAPPGISAEKRALQVFYDGEHGLRLVAPDQCFAG